MQFCCVTSRISKISWCGSHKNACDHLHIGHVSDQVTVLVDHTRKVVGHTRLGLSLRTKKLLWFKNESLWYSIFFGHLIHRGYAFVGR